jgi:alpha-glucosidase
MFRVMNSKSRLQIYLDEVLLIDHSRERPSIFLGKGNETFNMYHGNFEIVDELEERIALRDWRVKENPPKKSF